MFLDHDLGLFTGTEGDGLQVAQHLAGRGFDGLNTVIHSTNEGGAAAMKAALKNATIVPFGQFEIESTVTDKAESIESRRFSEFSERNPA